MQNPDDNALLREYVESGSEEAFATLVSRHVNKVYSVALRHTGNPAQAEEITQAVFVIFAKKSPGLRKGVILSGWLYHTARLTSVTFIRSEIRRARRQQEACMQNVANEPSTDAWPQIAPLLDAAMADLNEKDRHAVVLRFFDQKSMKEVGDAMDATEEASKKRVSRALEKLRKYFSKRGVDSTTAIIAGAISTHSVETAPVGLAKTAVTAALAKGSAAAGASTLTLINGALKVMAWTKAKTAIVITIGILLATGTSTVVVHQVVARSRTDPSWANDARNWALDSRVLDKLPAAFILRPTRFPKGGGGVSGNNRGSIRVLWTDTGVQTLVAEAYSFPYTRIIFPSNLPSNRFDLLLTMPNHPKEMLQDEIKKRFGLIAHQESREVDIFKLRVENPNAPNLKPSNTRDGGGQWSSTSHKITIRNQPLAGFIGSVESTMEQPVLDETGLKGSYDLDLQWKPRPGESEKDAFRRALSEQLGLELVPDSAPVELLIVEKAN
jgi:uncharacterized protein (TIGR03435 family)